MNLYNNTIYLTNNINITYSSYAPFVLTVDPSNISSAFLNNKKIRQIDYVWGDGTTTSVLYKPDPTQDLNPKNYTQVKKFLSKDLNLSVYYIFVNVYVFGSSTPKTYYITLNLKNPTLENYFEKVHLIKTRMFGADNQIVYAFETQNEENVLLSLVNWKLKPKEISIQELNKPYEIVAPFAQQFKNNKKAIITPSPSNTPYNPEDNTTINRLYP